GSTIGERKGGAEADLAQLYRRQSVKYSLGDPLAQARRQTDVGLGAFRGGGMEQQAVVQHGLDILVMHFLGDVDVELRVDVQRLGGTQLMFQDTNACIQGELAEEDASGGHKRMAL